MYVRTCFRWQDVGGYAEPFLRMVLSAHPRGDYRRYIHIYKHIDTLSQISCLHGSKFSVTFIHCTHLLTKTYAPVHQHVHVHALSIHPTAIPLKYSQTHFCWSISIPFFQVSRGSDTQRKAQPPKALLPRQSLSAVATHCGRGTYVEIDWRRW